MAGGKKRTDAIQWQFEVTSDEEWLELSQLPGLIVVDVYQEWCGPCLAMASHLKELKLQLGDELLHCATARADSISRLVNFRGRSEPTWLFMAAGECVSVIKGANVPLIRNTLLAELEREKQVLAGNAERNIIPWDSVKFSRPKLFSETQEEEPEPEESEQTVVEVPDNWEELAILCFNRTLPTEQLENLRQLLQELSISIDSELIINTTEQGTKTIFWVKSESEFNEEIQTAIKDFLERLKLSEDQEDAEEDSGEGGEPPETEILEKVSEFLLLVQREEKEDFIQTLQNKTGEELEDPGEGKEEEEDLAGTDPGEIRDSTQVPE